MKIFTKIMQTNKKINYIFEFRTPNGYLPIGVEYNSLPIVFDYINDLEYQHGTIVHRTGYSENKFKILNDCSSTYDVLTLGDRNIPMKTLYELTENEINNDINLYCIDTSHDETIMDYICRTDLTKILSEKSKKLFKDKQNFKLMVLDNKEGSYFFDSKFFESFQKFYKELGLQSDNQIIFVTNTCNVQDMYDEYLKKTNSSSFMKVKGVQFLIYDPGQTISDYFNQTNGKSQIIYDKEMPYSLPTEDELNEKREKYYLFLNRNSSRIHRAKLLLEFIRNKIFDKSLTSFLHSSEFDEFCEQRGNEEFKNLIKIVYPFVVDYENPYLVSDMHNFFTEKEMWMKTYFSVVSETSADDRWCFITEKTVRPMIYFHPFIVWGNPGTLKTLKDLGFETFPEFFDERYDNIKNSDMRMKMVLNNVKKLCELPIEEIHTLYQSVIPKLIHNRNHLIELYERKEVHTKVLETLF